ncbi:MAG: DUF2490 domain-containing protein [Candidatus Marinimicrobia bacterium]|nr:DUF2490 domain-containing protein [Candidatus Neomarinimicrobiota bacterium]
MKRNGIIVLLFMLVLRPLLNADDAIRENWGNLRITKSLSEKMKADFRTELRYIDPFDQYFNYFDLGLSWKINTWAFVSADFRHITKRSGTKWSKEYWPYADLKMTKAVQKFNLSNRSRLEVRIKEDENMILYRNKLEVKLPKLTKVKLQPFVADDVFLDIDNSELYRNRVHAGIACVYFKSVKYALSYILESTWKNDIRNDKDIFLLELHYAF